METDIIFWSGRSEGVAKILYGELLKTMCCVIDEVSDNPREFIETLKLLKLPNVVLFLEYNTCVSDCRKIKESFPDLKIGLVDYRGNKHLNDSAEIFDFCLVNSVEKKLTFNEKYPNIPCSFLVEYPLINSSKHRVKTQSSSKIKIGYHGNKIHLNSFYNSLKGISDYAIFNDKIIELLLVYDIKKLGKWDMFDETEFKNLQFEHLQWSEENIDYMLSEVDFGICPTLIPEMNINLLNWIGKRAFLKSLDDISMRFKAASNLGRALLFFQYGKPVIAEPTPSMVMAIGQNNERGYLVLGRNSTIAGVDSIVRNDKQVFADECLKFFQGYRPETQLESLKAFISTLSNVKPKSAPQPGGAARVFWTRIIIFECYYFLGRLLSRIGLRK